MKNIIIVLLMLFFTVGSSADLTANNNKNTIPKILDIPLIPTGYGLTKLSKGDYFLASIFIDRKASSQTEEDIIYIDTARRMEFKFVAEKKISGRSFGRQMAEELRINNDRETLLEHMPKIKQFIKMFNRSIKKGDILRFDYHQSFGTRIFLNRRMLGEIPFSTVFYRTLLRIWLGERPPSTHFKLGIMGQNGDDYALAMQLRYQSI